MKNFILALLPVLFIAAKARAEDASPAPKTDCSSTREFVTTKEYLDSRSDLSLDAGQTFEVADKVSKACTGAAKRFIRAFEVLMKVELGTRNALRLSLELAKRDDAYTETFLGVFQRAYLKEYMDLELANAVKMAESLSTDYHGDVRTALKDFTALTKFCMDSSHLGMTLGSCAQLASTVAKAGENFKKPMAPAFQRLVDFLMNEDGLKLPVVDAANMAQKIVVVSPDAGDNFIDGYEFATSDRGLSYSAADGLKFAQVMGQRTSETWALNEPPNTLRMPANAPTTNKSNPAK